MASRSAPLTAPIMRQALTLTLRPTPYLPTALRRLHPIITTTKSVSTLRPSPIIFHRLAHTIPRPPRTAAPKTPTQTQQTDDEGEVSVPPNESERPEAKGPAYYQLSFTCNPCGHRSHHNVSKQGYHFGSTLITCPSCRNRHVISDHLNIFGDRKFTIEDLMREKGQLVKRGSLGEDGDIEFWPDETDGGGDSVGVR